MQWKHVVAHTRGGFDAVAAWDSAAWLWPRLRRVFPDAAANILMPDHTHTLAPCDEERHAALRRVLQQHGRVFGTRWDLAPGQPVLTRDIARRTARYVLLNPVRAGLVADPLRWAWSTFRDPLGLVYDPWCQGVLVRRLLGYTPVQLWRYVVGDPTCSSEARRPLIRPARGDAISASFEAIASACAASLRCRPEDRLRKAHPARATFVALALAVGHPRPPQLAAACGVTRRAIRTLQLRADAAALACAHRCLVDPRFHVWQTPPRNFPFSRVDGAPAR